MDKIFESIIKIPDTAVLLGVALIIGFIFSMKYLKVLKLKETHKFIIIMMNLGMIAVVIGIVFVKLFIPVALAGIPK